MRFLTVLAVLLIASLPTQAQEPPTYAPPDQELWLSLRAALADVAMSLPSHQQILNILKNVEREAQMRAARAKAREQKKD